MSPLKIVAIIIFCLSVYIAVTTGQGLNAVWLMLTSFAVLSVFGGVIP